MQWLKKCKSYNELKSAKKQSAESSEEGTRPSLTSSEEGGTATDSSEEGSQPASSSRNSGSSNNTRFFK